MSEPQYENEKTETTPEENAGTAESADRSPDYTELLARVEAAEKRAADAESARTGGQVLHSVPEGAGGPGTDIAETWSQAEQEAFRDSR